MGRKKWEGESYTDFLEEEPVVIWIEDMQEAFCRGCQLHLEPEVVVKSSVQISDAMNENVQ